MKENRIETDSVKKVVYGVENSNQFADTAIDFPKIDEELLDADAYRITPTPSPSEAHFSGNKPTVADVVPSRMEHKAVMVDLKKVDKILEGDPNMSYDDGKWSAGEAVVGGKTGYSNREMQEQSKVTGSPWNRFKKMMGLLD